MINADKELEADIYLVQLILQKHSSYIQNLYNHWYFIQCVDGTITQSTVLLLSLISSIVSKL